MKATYWVWRRDLHVMLRAPIIYIVGGVFLAVHGVTFAALVGALSDPRRPSPIGALLEAQLAGTLLTWVLELVVLVLLGMRAIADDKRSGAWELLLTARVSEGAAVVGKWLAAATVYALLWLPTLAYLGLIAAFRADTGTWDIASIITGYAGAIAVGVALLAWAIAASAAMNSTLGAGALGFALLVGIFLAGEVPALAPALATDHPSLHAALAAISVRGAVGSFARGEISLAPVVLCAGLALTGLSAAIGLACVGRRRSAQVRTRAVGTLLVAVISMSALALAARHPHRWDVSSAKRSSLDPATRTVLGGIDRASLTIVRPTLGALEPIYDEVARVGALMSEVAPITVRTLDPASVPGGLSTIAAEAGVTPNDLASSGAVIVQLGARHRVLDLLSLATIQISGDAPTVEQLAVEQAITGALARLTQTTPITVCVTTGHAELPISAQPDGIDWSRVADRLRAEGMTVDDLPLPAFSGKELDRAPDVPAIPDRCTVVVVAGPATPLAQENALALQSYLARGGSLLVAAPSRALEGSVGTTGLETLLAASGLGLPRAIVVDPSLAERVLPGAIRITDGYSAHAINRGFANTRATVWFQPRAVIVERGARPLVSATNESWGETDMLAAPPVKQEDDLAGPVAVAAIGGGEKTIAIGSAESLTTSVLAQASNAADLWFAQAIRYLAHVPEPTLAPVKHPEQVRLVMTAAQRQLVTAIAVAGIPLVWIVLGGAIVWFRRRRAQRAGRVAS
ncbi:MAG TPA: Gldg family protein [Kofleriaceae bacterium]|jgi:ABC-2 type transport system permease protein